MEALASKLVDIIKDKGQEILFDKHELLDRLSTYFRIERMHQPTFEKCIDSHFFHHMYYKTNIDEILFLRHQKVSDFLDEDIMPKDARAVVNSFVQAVEYFRKIDIEGVFDSKKSNTYEILSGAIRNYNNGNYKAAITAMVGLTYSEMPEAYCHLGKCYFEGKAAAPDLSKAVSLFTKGAEANMSDSIYYLGLCLFKGSGIQQDIPQATEMFIKAAEMGQKDASYTAGMMCRDGTNGIAPDIKKAIKYLQQAADYGNWSAAIAICDLYYEDAKTTGNFRKTSEARSRISNASDAESCFVIGRVYEGGTGVKRDLDKALTFYIKAANKGNEDAAKMIPIVNSTIAAEKANSFRV